VELLERVRVMVARKRGPKKGHGIRPVLRDHVQEHLADRQAETSDPLAVGI
jgi:hypothetical protein